MRSPGHWRSSRRLLLAAAVAAGAGVLGVPAMAVRGDLDLASQSTAGVASDGTVFEMDISADGRRVAFESEADNLTADDADGVTDVFVRDLETNTTTLVSRQSASEGGAGGLDDSGEPSISADGRFVAFESEADNLSSEDDDVGTSVYVRDLAIDTTTLVSRASAAGVVARGADPSISADGRVVAFSSAAGSLVGVPDFEFAQIFVRDLAADTVTLVSRRNPPTRTPGNDISLNPELSDDGRVVAFASDANNLSSRDRSVPQNVFVYDLRTNRIDFVNRRSGRRGAAADSSGLLTDLSISGEGRYVAYESGARNLSDDAARTDNIFVRDRMTHTTILVSRQSDALGGMGANRFSDGPSISADGRRVAFRSFATNLSTSDRRRVQDVFVRDIALGTTELASRRSGRRGVAAADDSRVPAIAGEGRHLAFLSDAENLLPGLDGRMHAFRRDLGAVPPIRCGGRVATIVGSEAGDALRGTPGPDVIAALGGDDVVRGLGGDDRLCLGSGDDRGIGGRGDDLVVGANGNDVMLGGDGDDALLGGRGRDRSSGAGGTDRCRSEVEAAC